MFGDSVEKCCSVLQQRARIEPELQVVSSRIATKRDIDRPQTIQIQHAGPIQATNVPLVDGRSNPKVTKIERFEWTNGQGVFAEERRSTSTIAATVALLSNISNRAPIPGTRYRFRPSNTTDLNTTSLLSRDQKALKTCYTVLPPTSMLGMSPDHPRMACTVDDRKRTARRYAEAAPLASSCASIRRSRTRCAVGGTDRKRDPRSKDHGA